MTPSEKNSLSHLLLCNAVTAPPLLRETGYKVSTHTNRNWEVTTPKEEVTVFKCDTGICNSMSYIDLREHAEGHVMIKTVQKNL